MREITATEAARNFSDILDAVERRGEEFVISRKGRTIARLTPESRGNGKEVRELLRRFPPDADWARQIEEVRSVLLPQERDWPD